ELPPEDFRGLAVERRPGAQGGEPVGQRAAVDDQPAMVDLADGHELRSAASSFRRYNSSSASRGVRQSGSMASGAEAIGSGARSGSAAAAKRGRSSRPAA